MRSRHWDDDEVVARLYGLGPEDGHAAECEECAARLRAMQAAREGAAGPVAVSEEFLAAQRQSVYRELERGAGHRHWYAFAPAALATAAVVVLAVALYRPSPVPVADPSDAALFAESYALAAGEEPEAVQWMHGLFETEVTQ